MVEEVINKLLIKERVEEVLKKFGEIFYKFDKIEFIYFDDGFIRIVFINNLRRELFEKILKDIFIRRKRV